MENRDSSDASPQPASLRGLPLVVDLVGRRCLVVGGGSVAARRVPQLVRHGANVVVVAPDLHPSIRRAAGVGSIVHVQREFRAGDTEGAFLVLAATGSPGVNGIVAAEALDRCCLLSVSHDPSLGNCTFMAASTRGPLVVAFQTGGASPLVSALLRAKVESILPETLDENLEAVAVLRQELKARVGDVRERGRLWRTAASSGLLNRLLFDGDVAAMSELRRVLGLDR